MGKNFTLGLVAVLLLGFAGWRFMSAGDAKPRIPDKMRAFGVCLHCKQENEATAKRMDLPPFECPACGEKALYPWLYCNDCHYKFVAKLVRRPDRDLPIPDPFPYCTHCNCSSVSEYIRTNPNQNVIATSPLPKWPQ